MAKLVHPGLKIQMGKVYEVYNTSRKNKSECEIYVDIHVEDPDGDNEHWITFTPNEFERIHQIDAKYLSDRLKRGRLIPCAIRQCGEYMVYLQSYTPSLKKWYDIILIITSKQKDVAEARAAKKPEIHPKKSLIEDMLD